MPINIKIDPDATPEELEAREEAKKAPPSVKISLEIRKTLDGKIMILDHTHMDIILDTAQKKIITFPKESMEDEVYTSQDAYFKYLANDGVILPESVQSGNVFGSIEGQYPEAQEEGVSATQVVIFSTKKFLDEQMPHIETSDFIENELEDHLIEPEAEDSTELGEVPQSEKKGSITAYRIRRYLSGYGYY